KLTDIQDVQAVPRLTVPVPGTGCQRYNQPQASSPGRAWKAQDDGDVEPRPPFPAFPDPACNEHLPPCSLQNPWPLSSPRLSLQRGLLPCFTWAPLPCIPVAPGVPLVSILPFPAPAPAPALDYALTGPGLDLRCPKTSGCSSSHSSLTGFRPSTHPTFPLTAHASDSNAPSSRKHSVIRHPPSMTIR
ncbi:hypothetical protein P7K49_001882, partial [Saguinus oedipus]